MNKEDVQPGRGALSERMALHAHRFGQSFGSALGSSTPGMRLFFSPGRVNLMGAHLDYNGGPVMPAAIDRGTFLAVRPRADGLVRLASTVEDRGCEITVKSLFNDLERTGTWVDYPLGVASHISRTGTRLPGLDILVGGDLPIGAGLSSSASICVGTGFALNSVWDLGLSEEDLITAALWAEREFIGVKCGIMDPYAVSLTRPGHLLWLDCKDESFEHVPLHSEDLAIAVADTGVRRELAQGAFNERVEQCSEAFANLREFVPGARCLRDVPRGVLDEFGGRLDPAVRRRARHVVSEVERTFRARAALEAGDLAGFGREMSAAHRSLRDDFEVSIPELDTLVEAALEWDGVFGTRLTGAGFGGCIVIAVKPEGCDGLRQHLSEAFEARFGRPMNMEVYRAAGGPYEVEF